MRRMPVTMVAAASLAVLAVGTAGCGGKSVPSATPPVHAPASQALTKPTRADYALAGIYAQVLRQYLGTPQDNSNPGRAFKTAYVLDQAYRDAADPLRKQERGTPISEGTQEQVIADLAGMAHVVFVASGGSVTEAPGGGCGQVKDGGILITLGPPAGNGRQVRVPVNGWVACADATWLTYVLQNQPGIGWRVSGTTGSMAIA
jgi:hypothetical protein